MEEGERESEKAEERKWERQTNDKVNAIKLTIRSNYYWLGIILTGVAISFFVWTIPEHF